MDIPEIRPLTDVERSLTRWMLEQSGVEALPSCSSRAAYLAVWRCTALKEERQPFCRYHLSCA